jgi:rhamnosyltransferase
MSQNRPRIAAGIVLYNPDLVRLQENILAIKDQVDLIILIENGSIKTEYLQQFDSSDIVLLINETNKGIAFALNQICHYCYCHKIPWVLTLDQDSIVSPNLITTLTEYIQDDVGIVCPKIVDRNFKRDEDNLNYDVRKISWCITSASLTNVIAWQKVGGFDNSMFIDWVDLDFCISLRRNGYVILQTMKTQILHELGEKSRILHFRGRQIYLLNRPAFRYYYVERNHIYLGRKWPHISLKGKFYGAIETLFFVVLYEKHKWRNFISMLKGIFDGFRMPIEWNSIKKQFGDV